jgi:acyl-CoA thioesterase FadM
LTKIGGSSLTARVEAGTGGVVRVRATLVLVYLSLETHRPVSFPDDLRAKLARFQA